MRGDAGFPVRLRFTKMGKVRFVSHRDVARAFERAFRVEQLPLAFTQGFSPRPKVSFGLAIGVGHESVAEYLDVELADPVDLGGLPARLSATLPDGIDVSGTTALVERAPALQESVTLVEYRLAPSGIPRGELDAAVGGALAAAELPVETTRKGRSVVEDLRPGLRELEIIGDGVVRAAVATQPRGVRPADVAAALRTLAHRCEVLEEDRVVRLHQWIERDGARLEPLEADRVPRVAGTPRADDKGRSNDRRDHSGGDRLRARLDPRPDLPLDASRRIA